MSGFSKDAGAFCVAAVAHLALLSVLWETETNATSGGAGGSGGTSALTLTLSSSAYAPPIPAEEIEVEETAISQSPRDLAWDLATDLETLSLEPELSDTAVEADPVSPIELETAAFDSVVEVAALPPEEAERMVEASSSSRAPSPQPPLQKPVSSTLKAQPKADRPRQEFAQTEPDLRERPVELPTAHTALAKMPPPPEHPVRQLPQEIVPTENHDNGAKELEQSDGIAGAASLAAGHEGTQTAGLNPHGNGSSSGDDLSTYLTELQGRLQRNQYYPKRAQRRGVEGIVEVQISIAADGVPKDVKNLNAGANRMLRAAALETVARSVPLPPPPVSHSDEAFKVVVPMGLHMN